jgi:pilus assembly protein CpaB
MDRQRILMIFGAAWISAALLTWFLYSRMAAPKTEKMIRIVAASRDMSAGTQIKKGDLKQVSIPEKDAPRAVILDPAAALGRVLLYPVNVNEPVSSTKLGSGTGAEGLAATIEPGKRAVSVPVSDMTGAGGLIQPRSHVDVLFTRTGAMREAVTTTILQDVIVLSVGKLTETASTTVPTNVNRSATQNQAATLLVTPEEAQKLELARNQGRISLALRNPLDKTIAEETSAATAETLNPLLATGPRPLPIRNAAAGAIRDNRFWNDLTAGGSAGPQQPLPGAASANPPQSKKEPEPPPKPRFVVDVYRGDKHVQEIFQ